MCQSKRGSYLIYKGTFIRGEKGHLLKRKMYTCQSKRGSYLIYKGTFIRGENGHLYERKRGTKH